MKKLIALAALSTFALAACKDNTQAQLEQQQKQIEALQQQLAQQNGQQEDNTVYQLTPEAVKDTIPAEAQANGNNRQPVTGTDGQQYIYDQSTGSWLLQSLVGTAAGAFIGNALANKFTQARNQNSPIARQARANYYQTARPNGRAVSAAKMENSNGFRPDGNEPCGLCFLASPVPLASESGEANLTRKRRSKEAK